MQKIGVVIGASVDCLHTINKAKEQGIFVVAIDGNKDAVGLKYANKAIVADISNEELVKSVLESIKPDFILPVPIGRYLTTIGAVNEYFNLKGISKKMAEICIDKLLFSKALKKHSLRNIDSFLINKNTNFKDIENIKFPSIFKPRFGSGSRDVFIANNKTELKRIFDELIKKDEDFLLENMVKGVEYGVDGAIIDGKFHLSLLRKKLLTPLPICQAVGYISICQDEQNLLDKVYKYMQKFTKTLKLDNCLFHADIVDRGGQEDIFIIEASPRPSGHYLHDIFTPLSSNVDLAKEYINFLTNKAYNFNSKNPKKMMIKFFDFENVRMLKIPNKDDLAKVCNLISYTCNIKENEILSSVENGRSIIPRGYLILQGKDNEDLISQSKNALKQFQYKEIK